MEVDSQVLAESPWQVIVYRIQPVLIIAFRAIFGMLFAGVTGMVSIAVGWGLFVFFGGQSAQTWFIVQICAAGTGAGLGSIVVWFNIDRNTRLMLMLMAAVAVLGGLAGAWLGYEYGAYRNAIISERLGTTILLSPVTYATIGSAAMANLAMLAFRLTTSKLTAKKRKTAVDISNVPDRPVTLNSDR